MPPLPLKRKREGFSGNAIMLRAARPNYKRRRTFVPGQNRTSGFYGRFAKGSGELKFIDLDVNDVVVAQGGTIQTSGTINVISQGTTESERIRRKCTIRKMHGGTA